mgnify:CR=1 FL=1
MIICDVINYFIWSHISSSESPAADITEDGSLLSEQTTESSTEQLIIVTPRGRSDNDADNITSYNHQVIGHVCNIHFLQFCTRIARNIQSKAYMPLLTEWGPPGNARDPKIMHCSMLIKLSNEIVFLCSNNFFFKFSVNSY